MDSILNSVKKELGIAEDYTAFDEDIILHINSIFSVLSQLGVGPSSGFSITSSDDVWSDYISTSDANYLNMVKTYIYLRVRILFDPPQSSSVMDAFNNNIKELEWRLNVQVDPGGDSE